MLKEKLRGVVVATVLPFQKNGRIDWDDYEGVLDYCAKPAGISAVFVNGHAGECSSLTISERSEVIKRTRKALGDSKPIMAGVIPNTWDEGIEQAREAQKAGADCAVLFPLPAFQGNAAAGTAAPVAYVKAIAAAVDMPVSIFQYPISTGSAYGTETLVEIAQIKNLCMIKEGSGDPALYAENLRRIRAIAPHISMMPTNATWIMAQIAIGGDGILSGFSSLAPRWLVDLWSATEAGDLASMRRIDEQMNPLLRSIFAGPRMDVYSRIKYALHYLGIIKNTTPRPPLLPIGADTERRISAAVEASGLRSFIA